MLKILSPLKYILSTLKKITDFKNMPQEMYLSSYMNLDENLKYFTTPSLTIQSDNKKIKTKAYQFLYENWSVGNIIEILNRIINFTGNVIEYKAYGSQTAFATLERGYGVCTGKANLAVALCRALGIPSRVLFVFPTHFIVEIYLPGYGWVTGESTQGVFPLPKNSYTIQWIADIDDENYAGPRGGVIAYWGLEKNVNAYWNIEYDLIEWNEDFAMLEGNISLNQILFAVSYTHLTLPTKA